MSTVGGALTPDTWLGFHLGCSAFRLELPGKDRPEALEAELIVAVRTLDREGKSFAYIKVPADAVIVGRLLAAHGFYLVDTNVTFAKPAPEVPVPMPPSCRLATPADEEAVVAIAASSFVYTRFHLDPAIPPKTADRIKGEWARNFFRGKRGDVMVVAEIQGQVVGFNQMLRDSKGNRVTDLIGVHPDFRRRGLGRALCRAAEHLAGDAVELRVGTQVANVPSVCLYEQLGYRLQSATYVYHRHR